MQCITEEELLHHTHGLVAGRGTGSSKHTAHTSVPLAQPHSLQLAASGHQGRLSCPNCGGSMMQVEHIPTVLCPCGHTVCSACASDQNMQHSPVGSGRTSCPVCLRPVQSSAVNVALQRIFDGTAGHDQLAVAPASLPDMRSPTESVGAPAQLEAGRCALVLQG
jgi:hypothetical protein